MSLDPDHAEEPTDLSKLPPPPAWRPASKRPDSAELYDFEAEGDDPALDEMDVAAADATIEMDAQTRGARVALDEGATPPATLLTWLRWSTGPRETPRPGGLFLPGRYVWRSVANLAGGAHRWATDATAHPDAWRLTELKPHYATKQAAYDQWEERIKADLADRPKTLLIGGFVLAVTLVLFSVITVWLGMFYVFVGAWSAILLGLSLWGRHVAPDRGATRGARVAVDENATPATPETPRVPGREEIRDALRHAGVIKADEEIETDVVREVEGGAWATTITLPRTTTAADAIKELHGIAGAFDTIDPKVTMRPDPESNRRVWLRVGSDPLTGMAPRSPLIEAKGTVNVWNGIPFGFTVGGKRVRVTAVGTHWQVVGASGSGKSRAFGLLPLGYALDPYTRSLLLDPEGFGAWLPFSAVATVIQGSEPAKLRAMAAALVEVVEVEFPRRQAVIDFILKTEPALLPNNEIDAKISRTKRYNVPAYLIACEEAVTLFSSREPYGDDSDRTIGQVAQAAWGEIQRRGRKYAISACHLSQKATTAELPATITFGATTRFMLACSTPTQADSAMPGWRDLGMTPLKLKPAKPNRPGSGNAGAGFLMGVGLVEPEEDWALLRSDYADGNEIAGRMAYARQVREKVWPELLPDFGGPDQGGSAQPAPPEPEPDDDGPPAAEDPARLEELEGCYAEGEAQLRSVTLIGRLQARYPEDEVYRALTERGMNRFLRPFGLRTTTVRDAGGKGAGLPLSVIQEARDACHDEPEDVATLAEPGAIVATSGSAEMASDQGRHDATQLSGEPPSFLDRPDSAEGDPLAAERGNRRPHLGQVALPVVGTGPHGGFS